MTKKIKIFNIEKLFKRNTLYTISLTFFFCIIGLVCFFLGSWQMERAAEKEHILSSLIKVSDQQPFPYAIADLRFIPRQDFPYIVIETPKKSYDCYQVISTVFGDFLLHLGERDNFPSPKDFLMSYEREKNLRFYPVSQNPFVKKILEYNFGIYKSYHVAHVLKEPIFKNINHDLVLLDIYPEQGYIARAVDIPLSPQRHRGYAFQWFLLAACSFFYSINLGLRRFAV